MSAATATRNNSDAQLRSLQRVQAVPIVNDAMSTLNALLLKNTLTAWPYSTAQSISYSVYKTTEPLQARFTPVLVPFDGLANRGLDFVETRYPYPFQTPTDTVVDDIMKQRDQLAQVASSTYDARIKKPIEGVAQGMDQAATPLVNVLQTAYDKLYALSPADGSPNKPIPVTPGDESQIQRAKRLTFGLKDQVIVLSSEQLRQLQHHNVVVQRLTEALYNLNGLVASSITAAKDRGSAVTKEGSSRANGLAEAARSELERLSATLRAMPENVQHTFKPVQKEITETMDGLKSVVTSDAAASEKATRALQTLREQVPPLIQETLRAFKEGVVGALDYVQGAGAKVQQQQEKPKVNGVSTNGNGKGHGSDDSY